MLNWALKDTTVKTGRINGTDLVKWCGERVASLLRRISLTDKVYCERRELRKLSDEQLADIGISRAEVSRECNKRFMDIPDNRKHETPAEKFLSDRTGLVC